MSLIIAKATMAELEDAGNIGILLEEYADESSIKGLPHPYAKAETYKLLEKTGATHVYTAVWRNMLIGFIIVLDPKLPHYDVRVAIIESFFVGREYRKTGAGLKLLRMAENYAKEAKACGVMASAPIDGVLADVLSGLGYAETNRVFFKSIGDV